MEDQILVYLKKHQNAFLEMLRQCVELESPSGEDKRASDRCGDFLEDAFRGLGFKAQRIARESCGNHVTGEIGAGEKSVLIVGHYDTVYPIGTIKKMPFKIENGKAYGPGVLDMKGGLVMAYFALKALLDLNLMPEKIIGIFFNSDEESGSFQSSEAIVAKAREFENVLVAEPGVNSRNSVKTGRYGRGTCDVIVHGVAAHSGSNPHLAVSPVIEMAHQLLCVDEWNRETDAATFAPTFISGGTAGTCMVPETAYFTMDIRFRDDSEREKVQARINRMKAVTPGAKLEIRYNVDKPVMAASPELFAKAVEIGRHYGLELEGVTVGGGSDGNFTSAAGIPTLDGLGATGEYLHNPREYIHIEHIPYRTALLAKMLSGL
ncbi:peptidase M20 [Spirochaetia bacterium]|nr:peptidase M20 [Spirochaetia bacterium]